MSIESLVPTVASLIKASGLNVPVKEVGRVGAAATFLGLIALVVNWANFGKYDRFLEPAAAFFIGLAIACAILLLSNDAVKESRQQQADLAQAEELVQRHPDEPQFAWDLARKTLESYLNRNLAQVQSIYRLTLVVMVAGFLFIGYGLFKAFDNPAALPVSIVAAASGVLISFVGGSLLIIYRSVLLQSREYIGVLERINAVGMAVNVIAQIPDTGSDLKNQSTADLAKQLLTLYTNRATGTPGANT